MKEAKGSVVADDAVFKKMKGLLALAETSDYNENQAIAAANKLQEFLTRYNLTIDDLRDKAAYNEQGQLVDEEVLEQMGQVPEWRSWLFATVAKVCFCEGYISWRRFSIGYNRKKSEYKFVLIGKSHNIAVARELYSYLITTIYRLGYEAGAEEAKRYGVKPHASFFTSFKIGISSRLCARLREKMEKMKKEGLEANGEEAVTALVVASAYEKESKAIQEWKDRKGLDLGESKKSTCQVTNWDGYRAGVKAGDKVGLHDQIGAK